MTNQTQLDLSGYKTASGAAKALHRYLTEELDANADLYSPDDNPRQNGAWGVSWEGGPYEWAIALTGGESLFAWEGGYRFDTTPEVVGFYADNGWHAEPYYKFDLQFYDQ